MKTKLENKEAISLLRDAVTGGRAKGPRPLRGSCNAATRNARHFLEKGKKAYIVQIQPRDVTYLHTMLNTWLTSPYQRPA